MRVDLVRALAVLVTGGLLALTGRERQAVITMGNMADEEIFPQG
jgi:hypothetical protein